VSRAANPPSPWELAAEAIVVKVRWFGLLVGCSVALLGGHEPERLAILGGLLALGAAYTAVDTWASLRGRILLRRSPLVISALESVFIALLCYFDSGLESPFRYYYFLSLLCCAVRHPASAAYATCAIHCATYAALYLALPPQERRPFPWALTLVTMGWVTWASVALTSLLKHVGDHLAALNEGLERRIAERTAELQAAQARVLHQEKMASFGLLAAGIAHEVGNPLTGISNIVQLLLKQDPGPQMAEKLEVVSGQLARIRGTLRELVEFSRPADQRRGKAHLSSILEEALGIAKYYKRAGRRIALPEVPPDLPPIEGARGQLVQAFLNLILNAIDAAGPAGRVVLEACRDGQAVVVSVRDDGPGIAPEDQPRVFTPYFTTKKDGTGLGLFVTQQLIQGHGGEVSFDTAPGQGSAFHVRLPLAARENAA
jgi:signal transduction histidine kinase